MKIVERQFQSNGLKVNYAEAGSGPVIIFLHNGAGMWQSWQKQIAYFSEKYLVYAIDWPGCAASEYPEGGMNMSILERTLDDFIALKKLEDICVIGNCIGASAALNYAIKSPSNVKKTILLNMCPGDLIFPKIISRKYIKGLSKRKKAKSLMEVILACVYNRLVIQSMFPKNLFGKKMNRKDDFYQLYKSRLFLKAQEKARIDLFFNAYTYNLNPIIANKEVPDHMLIWGRENRILNLKTLGMLHFEMLKSKEFHIIDGAGHLCMYEKPEQINALIDTYING